MSITREFKLPLFAGRSVPLLINANQYDQGETWLFTLLDENGQKYTPASGAIVGLKSDGHVIANAGTVNSSGQVVITETEQMTASPGKNIYEVLIDSDTHGTNNFTLFVERRPGDQEEPSDSDLSMFQEAIDAAATIGDVTDLVDDVAVLTARMDSYARLPDGSLSTAADAELADIRVGADGTTYPTAGDAVRGQVGDLKNAISSVVEYPELYYTFSPGYIKTGNISIGTVVDITPVVPSTGTYSHIIADCASGDKFHLDSIHGSGFQRAWAFIDSENKLLANSSDGTKSGTITAPENASKVIFNDVNATKGTVYKVGGTDGFNALITRVTNAETAIETNTNSIKEIVTSNKNLWTGDASQTFTKSKTVTLTEPIPAGTYTLSATVTSSDTDAAYSRFQVNNSSITGDLTRDSRNGKTFTTTAPITSITFFAGRNSTGSAGDTATWADIQLESGSAMTPYVPHKLTTVDDLARDMIYKIVKYVSTSGSDANDGNSASSAYATFAKAIAEGADTIYIAHGTYNEGSIPENQSYRNRGVRIIADGATIVMGGTNGFGFRLANVNISGLTIDVTNASSTSSYGILLLNCTGELSDCTVIGAKGAGGYRLDGSKMTLTRCVASQCAVDGFNGHTVNAGYETEVTLIDCIAHDCGDDGASIHENGKMYIYGGEYYNNVQTGLAPHNRTAFEAFNVHCHHNGKGIEAVENTLAEGATPAVGRVIGCILNDNTTYGLDVKNYTVNALTNGYANNGTAPTRTQTGGTINSFTVI